MCSCAFVFFQTSDPSSLIKTSKMKAFASVKPTVGVSGCVCSCVCVLVGGWLSVCACIPNLYRLDSSHVMALWAVKTHCGDCMNSVVRRVAARPSRAGDYSLTVILSWLQL